MNRKHVFYSVLTGFLLAFSHPNFIEQGLKIHTFFFIWFAYIPLLYVLLKESLKKNLFICGIISGSVFYLTAFYWMWNIKPMGAGAYVAWLSLGVYLSVFLAVSLVLARVLEERFKIAYLFSLPAAFTVMEFCREWMFSGFQLLTPAQSQHQFLALLAMLSITGVYGPAFLILFVNMLALKLLTGEKPDLKNASHIAALACAIMLVLFAFVEGLKPAAGSKIRAAIIQPDIDQDVEWSQEFKEASLKTYKGMITGLKDEKPEIIIWPETGYPGILNMEPWKTAEMAAWLPGAYNLVGSDSYSRDKSGVNYYNSAFLLDDKGAITGTYSKFHLVPFGEYIPFQHTLSFVKKVVRRYGYTGFTPGTKIEPLDYNGTKLGVVICYDGLFPEISREFVKKGARFLAHLSYETWYGRTPATSQIFLNTAMRAIENGVPLIRSVSSGISGFVAANGKIYSTTGLFERRAAVADIEVDAKAGRTFYTLFGDWFVCFLAFLTAVLIIKGKIQKNDSVNN